MGEGALIGGEGKATVFVERRVTRSASQAGFFKGRAGHAKALLLNPYSMILW